MKENKLISAMDLIDEKYMQEAITEQKPAIKHTISKRRTLVLVAAVLLVILATGAGYAFSLLNVDVSSNVVVEASQLDTLDVQNVELNSFDVDYLRRIAQDIGEDQATNIEYLMKEDRYSEEINRQRAEEYGVEYQDDILYYLRDYDGKLIELGAFYTVDNVFVYFHTDDRKMFSEMRVFVYLFNPKTNEAKLDYVILEREGAYTVNLSADEGWLVVGALVTIHHEYYIGGKSSTFAWKNDEKKEEFILANREIVNFTGEQYDELNNQIREIEKNRNSSEDYKFYHLHLEWLNG